MPDAWDAIVFATAKIQKKRKHRSAAANITNTLLFRSVYDDLTDENCHAELVHAELQAITSVITVIEDQSLMGFVKGAIRIRYVFQENAIV